MTFYEISPQTDFAKQEETILKFWDEENIFEKSITSRSTDKAYSFYDGPPFATGLPHYGHLLASILKDIVPRYWTMKGHRIERRFGWDCHGLPIEYEIDKTLGISGAAGVEQFGIAKYNAECRSIVQRFALEWQKTITRIGRWVDFKNDYKTMDASFMESVWWVFKQLWDKGLVYQGYRVMPYSTAVATPLSNFEAGSNYKDVQDPAITVTFKSDEDPNLFYLAWTTTPWTLPSNLALSVGGKTTYVKVLNKKDGRHLVLAKSRLESYFAKPDEYEILNEFAGSTLENKTYVPLFDYFLDRKKSGAFKILVGDHVTDTDGTGIVHTAPAFGEEDFNICRQYGIDLVLPVDADGKFTAEVRDFSGKHVKEADRDVIKHLKENGKLFKHDTIVHSVPFCWRSDTPLIYRAVSSWFVSVEKIKDRLIANNQNTHWVPEGLRDGRFGNWLADARDWNISRNRFWGNPLPIWKNSETGEFICVGSIHELEELSGKKITDIHRENIDDILIPAKDGKGDFKRVPEVLDCWFESGAMPYAQSHYPFANKVQFEKSFPADFIAEGLDQTRGWFYTLAVLGTALFDTLPFKNVIVNGLILAEDGKKMSKRLKNYPDPQAVIDAHGADALRLYLINSPVVRAEELRFSEAGVKDIVRRVLLKWWNAYSFFISYATIDKWTPSKNLKLNSDNILDRWILSRMQSLLKRTEHEMGQYHLYNVVPALLDFIEDLTNTYIRLNRKRFWGEDNSPDKLFAYQTLYYVLFTLTKVMAPFTPFLSESMFQNLKQGQEHEQESVHLSDFPVANEKLILPELEKSVALAERVILMGRNLREKQNIKIKIPLKKMDVIHRSAKVLSEIKSLEIYIREELNIRNIDYLTNEDDFVSLTAKGNGAALGPRFGKKFGLVNKAIQQLKSDDIVKLEQGEMLTLEGETISKSDTLIYRNTRDNHPHLQSDPLVTINLDMTLGEDQVFEGLAREVVNRIQKLRKTANLKLSDRIRVEFNCEGTLKKAIEANQNYIMEQTLALEFVASATPDGQASEDCDVDGEAIRVALKNLTPV